MEKTEELINQLVKDYGEVERLKNLPKEELSPILQQKTEELYEKVINANDYEYFKIVDELFLWQRYFDLDYLLIGKAHKGNLSYEDSKDKIYNSLPFIMRQVDPLMTFLVMPIPDWCNLYKDKVYSIFDKHKERERLNDYNLLSNGINSKKDKNKLYYVEDIPVWYINYQLRKFGINDKTICSVKSEWAKRFIKYLNIPDGFDYADLSYFVSKYYNIDFTYQEGKNAPKLAKQLSKLKIDYTNDEIIAFTELDTLLKSIKEYNNTQHILLSTTDFTIPKAFTNLSWAFQGSCHAYDSSTGGDSPQFLRAIGFKMVKLYFISKDGDDYSLCPCSRIYFYENKDGHIGMAGAYSNCENSEINHTAYQASRLILSVIFNKRLADFVRVAGLPSFPKNSKVYNSYIDIWLNVSNSNDYVTYGTDEDIFNFNKDYLSQTYSNLLPMSLYHNEYIKKHFIEKPSKLEIKGE